MKQTLGEILKQLREEKGLTQQELAELVLTSPQSISRWEKDEREPSFDMLKDLLFYLGNPPLIIENREIKIGGIEMETLRGKAMNRLKELDEVIAHHDENEEYYRQLTGLITSPDLVNDIVFNELGGKIPTEITSDIYMEMPLELHYQVEEVKTKSELENVANQIEILISFWEQILFFEKQRIEGLKKTV